MADRIFKGRLLVTADIHEENQRAFPEASDDFRERNAGGLDPFQVLYNILMSVEERFLHALPPPELENPPEPCVKMINGSLWISGAPGICKGTWIKIDPTGDFEIGASGA